MIRWSADSVMGRGDHASDCNKFWNSEVSYTGHPEMIFLFNIG